MLLQTAAEAFSAERNFPTLNCPLPVPGCQGFAQLKLHGPFPRILLLPQRSIPAAWRRAPRAALCRRVQRRDPRPGPPKSLFVHLPLSPLRVRGCLILSLRYIVPHRPLGPGRPRQPSVLSPHITSPRSPCRPRPRTALPAGVCRSPATGAGAVTSRWSCGPRPRGYGRRRQ